MSEQDDRKLREFLRSNMPRADVELRRDLWPQALERFSERSRATPWFDWALVGATLVLLLLFPKTISVLLYHF